MKKLYCLIFVILVFCQLATGQNKPVLLADISPNWDDLSELINHDVVDSVEYRMEKDPNSLFAVRICSPDPLPITFASINRGQFLARQIIKPRLERLREQWLPGTYAAEMYFLRNTKECKSTKGETHVEYWYVPSCADLPEFVEISKADDITLQYLTFSSKNFNGELISQPVTGEHPLLTPEYYKIVVNKVKELLIKNKTAYLLIETNASGRGARNVQIKVNKLKSLLNQIGIGNHRIFIKKSGWEDSTEDLYPNLTLVYQK